MKARYRYRIYPTPSQKVSLAKLFGCTRVVWNDALAYCMEQYRAGNKKTKGSNRYERARKRRAKLYAKLADTRSDFLHKLSTRLIRDNQTVVLEDLNVSGMVRNRKLSRAISDLGWRQFRTLCESKSEKYSRDFRTINRWEPSSQKCSCCGFRGGKLDLSVREWKCANCGAYHYRDINAANNLVAGGQSETRNGRGGKHKTSAKEAVSTPKGAYSVREASTHQNSSAQAGG